MKVFGLCVVLGAPLVLGAEEKLSVLAAGSEVYSNVTILQVSATDIYFTHSRGLGNAKLKTLSPELREKFHYDEAKATAKQQEQSESSARYREALIEADAARPATSAPDTSEPPPPTTEVTPHEISAKSFLGQQAPEMIAEKWLTPQPDTAGKFILLDFWATWCAPCRRSIPELNGFHNKFKDKLVVIGLSDEAEQTVRGMTSPKIDYALAIDTHARLFRTVEVTAIPHAMLLDPKGIVRFEGHPAYLDESKLEELLTKYAQ
jgi:thiol-disulfide isomerase/thioredoxin